eukprot:Skav219216  [mRNA]  locus=scaffold1015:21763:25981:+ [translate_table: standard]
MRRNLLVVTLAPVLAYPSELLSKSEVIALGVRWRGNATAVSSHEDLPTDLRRSELLSRQEAEALGVIWRGNATEQSSHEELAEPSGGYPEDFSWCNKDGVNYCTVSLNQHIPQKLGLTG